MGVKGFPTSSDIYLEAEGRKIAVVQSYKATARRSEQVVEAFGEKEPVATVADQVTYRVELTRLYATDEAISDGINFHDLDNFSLVIVKPDRRIVYTGCQWSEIAESGELSEMVAEKISVIASHRVETTV
ncbi:MAG TPA: hypothetical protein GXZ52_00635 [Clostridiales bacterium]|jgi:hypothetical protein|nr:hypothetical protein [Clostridiales bacterium]